MNQVVKPGCSASPAPHQRLPGALPAAGPGIRLEKFPAPAYDFRGTIQNSTTFGERSAMWIAAAFASAFFAGITAILAKCGVRRTDSDLATAIRTVVVLLFAWLVVLITGAQQELPLLNGRTILFLTLSGLATCGAWLCYFKALSLGDVNKVVPAEKSGIVLAVIAGILFFGETAHLPLKLFCTALIAAGTVMMVEKRYGRENAAGSAALRHGPEPTPPKEPRTWLLYAFLSAVFAAATSLLAKIGLEETDANLGTAVRTVVILAAAWIVAGVRRKFRHIKEIPRDEILFLLLSGLSTGISWICYFYAIQKGPVSAVVPIDRLSILVSIVFARLVFKERLSLRGLLGLTLITAGTAGLTFAG